MPAWCPFNLGWQKWDLCNFHFELRTMNMCLASQTFICHQELVNHHFASMVSYSQRTWAAQPDDASWCDDTMELNHMLVCGNNYHTALGIITGDRTMDLRKFEMSQEEWTILEQLQDVLKMCSLHYNSLFEFRTFFRFLRMQHYFSCAPMLALPLSFLRWTTSTQFSPMQSSLAPARGTNFFLPSRPP